MIPDAQSDFWPRLSRWLNVALRSSADNTVRHLGTVDVFADTAHSDPERTILAATALVKDRAQFRYSLHIHLNARLKNVTEMDWERFLALEPLSERLEVDKGRRTLSVPRLKWQ